jgi:hypothetical protein
MEIPSSESFSISRIIDRNIANRAIATPIKGVVPQPGATWPSRIQRFQEIPYNSSSWSRPRTALNGLCSHQSSFIPWLRSVDFVYYLVVIVNKWSSCSCRSTAIFPLFKNGNSNPSRHLHIWFTCQFDWVRLIYCFWATLSTTQRSIRGTRRLVDGSNEPPNMGGSWLPLR